jgi:2-phosphosulfolactate phosphatase
VTSTVTIGCLAEDLPPPFPGSASVVVDVIRAATTAVTAVAGGRRTFVAGSIEKAVPLAARLERPILAGELGGNMPYGFELQNSPSAVATANDAGRPLILLSTTGTRLMVAARDHGPAYVACLRNVSAQVEDLVGCFHHVRLLAADSRGEFREEDQLCCGRIAESLLSYGFVAGDSDTERMIDRWRGAADDSFLDSRSVAYLRDTGQEEDLDFILGHVDDLRAVVRVAEHGELLMRPLS